MRNRFKSKALRYPVAMAILGVGVSSGMEATGQQVEPPPTVTKQVGPPLKAGTPASIVFASKTPCAADASAGTEQDEDVKIRNDGNFNVMFHGNRFVIAREIVAAFEAEHPGVRVSYTAIPPINTIRAVQSGGTDAGQAGVFAPDVVMGPRSFGELRDGQSAKLDSKALYSRIHGLVLMARAGDARVEGTDWLKLVRRNDLRIVIPGDQQRQHVLIHSYAAAFGEEGVDAMKTSRRVGVSSIKHHRAIPARIEGKCEDIGLQFAQSRAYWEQQKPGAFRFVDVTASETDLALEDSYVFSVAASTRQDLANKFARFMTQPTALSILTKYSLEP